MASAVRSAMLALTNSAKTAIMRRNVWPPIVLVSTLSLMKWMFTPLAIHASVTSTASRKERKPRSSREKIT